MSGSSAGKPAHWSSFSGLAATYGRCSAGGPVRGLQSPGAGSDDHCVKGATRTDTTLPTLGRGGDWSALDAVSVAVTDRLAAEYAAASPYRHLVLDGLFDPELLRAVRDSFPDVPAQAWGTSSHPLQRKHGTVADVSLPPAARDYFEGLHGAPMRRFLSRLTGIADLLPDPSLLSAGMHEVPDGGRFELHVDFLHQPKTLQRNRIVVITYLNEGWLADFGGALELWHWKPRALAATVLPVLGRTIVMEVGPRNVHGHPHAVHAPDGRSRRSVAAYFYTAPDPDAQASAEVTGYVDRPGARLGVRALRLLHASTPRFLAGRARSVLGRRPSR